MNKILSYFWDVPVEKAKSRFNKHLAVSWRQGRLMLSASNAIYSFDDLYTNFKQAFEHVNIQELRPKKVLVLGFGLGSVPYMLEKTFGLECEVTGIELDDTVVRLARTHSLPRLSSEVNVVCADALGFVEQCHDAFDLIAMDIFIDDKVPETFEEPAFVAHLHRLLAPNGLLLYNRLSRDGGEIYLTDLFFKNVFKQEFPDAQSIFLDGNTMLINK